MKQTVFRWVKASERLPKTERSVLQVKIANTETEAWLHEGKWWSYDINNAKEEVAVTEWWEEVEAIVLTPEVFAAYEKCITALLRWQDLDGRTCTSMDLAHNHLKSKIALDELSQLNTSTNESL
jgi:hypothetical protein